MDVDDGAQTKKFNEAPLLTFAEELPGIFRGEEDREALEDGEEWSGGEGGDQLLGRACANGSTWQEMLADYDKIKDIALADTISCEKATALLARLQADKAGADVRGLVEKALEAAAGGVIGTQSMYVVQK
ncbi:hypothetical protein CLAFUW4_04378 [Fulvia fulva]|uniref:Uncharacterized protein n=1 Tax=Passalora fulva TaxID=5499 RepID=A0A9Q8LFF8_PASFU|nr:uncharacterized protein CLAFUR5_04341 [Fulvia fulva]KAK4626802.1 hypothetical protein CLAFUR4_04364 [Fulvia fulva]KAK4628559.1 hypothetical protein CLAFUR0_04365 [Fulvia fulva]UJO16420.1 hypothetical protein CLAFUR5_04341 [Fulvia fulva]WPV13484.1 hypothetical protein CLAFUW4_04378 [Fulvia fulva]WPV29118.1 hypothetical protein CLAFUW7_04367 [Fulvia fulva]